MKTTSTERSTANSVLQAVADDQRRAVLGALEAADDVLDYETLTDRVVERIRSDDATVSVPEHRERVRSKLYHTHLPKLADSGLIVYDTEQKLVRSVADERTRELLELVDSLE